MATAEQYNTSLQVVRNISVKINILDYNMDVLDEVSGVATNASISIDADADIRRTANITMIIHADYMPTGVQSIDIGSIWVAGNPYWFDKYIQIYVGIADMLTQEIAWVNQGIYLINAPSINYDATTSELSFSGVDLMAKLTGIRNGYLEGMTYQVNAGDSITGAIRAVLEEQGFYNAIIKTPPTTEVPNDISIDIGGTAYDLLSQLRDINPNWEMFFDVDGVFYFQQIPSATPTEPPLIDDEVWSQLNTGYSLETSFEDVKNYIEVVGKTIEVDETVTPTTLSTGIRLDLSKKFADYKSSASDTSISWYIGFTMGDVSLQPTRLSSTASTLTVKDSEGSTKQITLTDEDLLYNNQSYFIRMTADDTTVTDVEFGGYLSIRAIAFEQNEESPFYVGDATSGTITTEAGGNASWGDELNMITTVSPSSYSSHTASLNVSPWVDYSSSSTSWRFYFDISEATDYVSTLNITANGYSNPSLSLVNAETSPANVSADYANGTYVLELTKTGVSTMSATLYYISIPASNWETPTNLIYSLPNFSRRVRGVCSGDEYDNIYTNDLAKQRAKYEIYLKSRLHDTLTLTCVPIYWLDVNTLISYTLPNSETQDTQYWIVKTISTDLTVTGTQSVSAMRFYPLYP